MNFASVFRDECRASGAPGASEVRDDFVASFFARFRGMLCSSAQTNVRFQQEVEIYDTNMGLHLNVFIYFNYV